MNKKRNRPCNGRCFALCVPSFLLFLISFLMSIETNDNFLRKIFIIVATALLALNIFFCVVSIFKWNSFVFLDKQKISQKQFNKYACFCYNEIDDIKITMSYYAKVPYLISVFSNKKKISFEITSDVFEHFVKNCSNEDVLKRLNKLMLDRNLI